MTIERWQGGAKGRNRAVRHDGIVYTVTTAASAGPDIQSQTRASVEMIEQNLNDRLLILLHLQGDQDNRHPFQTTLEMLLLQLGKD